MLRSALRTFESLVPKPSRLSSTCFGQIRRIHATTRLSLAMMPSASNGGMPPGIRLILDWDGTITREDTMSVIFAMGNYTLSAKTCAQLCQNYYDEYRAHSSTYRPVADDRKTVAQELEWLQSLAPIEAASVRRFSDSGAFKGLKVQDVVRHARGTLDEKSVELSEGWERVFSKVNVENPRLQMSILTVNWSETFIREVLRESTRRIRRMEGDIISKQASDTFFDEMVFMGNDFSGLHEEQGSNGRIISTQNPAMQTAASKIKAIRRMREPDEKDVFSGANSRPIYIYVGDSSTDLGALTSPDVDAGIYMRSTPETSLVKVLQRIGIECESHIEELKIESVTRGVQRDEDGFAKQVFWARNLGEIQNAVHKLLIQSP